MAKLVLGSSGQSVPISKITLEYIEVEPVVDTLNVVPKGYEQTIEAPEDLTGYNAVFVEPISAKVDSNIKPNQIKENVEILGVTGTFKGDYNRLRIPFDVDENGKLTTPSTIIDLDGAINIQLESAFMNSYINNLKISGKVDFSSLQTISGDYACNSMFQGCTNITSIDLSNLARLQGGNCCKAMFQDCINIESHLDLSSLITTADSCCYSMFNNCKKIPSVDLSNLLHINTYSLSYMFQDCTGLKTVNFKSLAEIQNNGCTNTFQNCTNLKSLYFPSLNYSSFLNLQSSTSNNKHFSNLLSGCTNVKLHFSSNNDVASALAKLNTYPNFGGTGTVILYDLDPSLIVDLQIKLPANTILYDRDGMIISKNQTIVSVSVQKDTSIYGIEIRNNQKYCFTYTIPMDVNNGDTIDLSNLEYTQVIFTTEADKLGDSLNLSVTLSSSDDVIDFGSYDIITGSKGLYLNGSFYTLINLYSDNNYLLEQNTILIDTSWLSENPTYFNIPIYQKLDSTIYNFEDLVYLLTPAIEEGDCWNIDNENQRIIINNPNNVKWNTSKFLNLNSMEEDPEKVVISVKGYVSSELNWDWGFAILSSQEESPTHQNIKNNVVPSGDGSYVFRQTGENNVLDTYSTITEYIPEWNVLSIGYAKDTIMKGTDSFYLYKIELSGLKELIVEE